MITSEDINLINQTVQEMLEKMTATVSAINAVVVTENQGEKPEQNLEGMHEKQMLEWIAGDTPNPKEPAGKETVLVDIEIPEPQMFIGQNGQTLAEFGRVVAMVVNKKLKNPVYVKVDINQYTLKKTQRVQEMARNIAREVAVTKEKKVLPPMSSYDRRIVHAELANHPEVTTQSQGEGSDRRIVILPK